MDRKLLTVQARSLTGKKVAQMRRSGTLPGNVYGSFRQRVWGDARFTTIYEVASLTEYDEMVRARGEVLANDERWRELWRGWNSLLVPQSCQVSFHQRWPG